MLSAKVINKQNLLHNFDLCKKITNKNIMAMVKADAYGHGLFDIVSILVKKCKWFGVATVDEAICVKKIVKQNANVLVVTKSENFDLLIKNEIHITIDSFDELSKIEKICNYMNKLAYVHLAINTGMNRIGLSDINEFVDICKRISVSKNIKLCGVFTHMFDADIKYGNYDKQLKKLKDYKKVALKGVPFHIGGTFCLNHRIPDFVGIVRVGFGLYGYGLKNSKIVMSVWGRITKITDCKAGQNLGYGSNILKKDTRVATVSLGYFDGIPRRISNKGYVFIGGVRCKVLGKVCMDCLFVDISKTNAKIMDKVDILLDATQIAKWANTSPYEILTNFSKIRAKNMII